MRAKLANKLVIESPERLIIVDLPKPMSVVEMFEWCIPEALGISQDDRVYLDVYYFVDVPWSLSDDWEAYLHIRLRDGAKGFMGCEQQPAGELVYQAVLSGKE